MSPEGAAAGALLAALDTRDVPAIQAAMAAYAEAAQGVGPQVEARELLRQLDHERGARLQLLTLTLTPTPTLARTLTQTPTRYLAATRYPNIVEGDDHTLLHARDLEAVDAASLPPLLRFGGKLGRLGAQAGVQLGSASLCDEVRVRLRVRVTLTLTSWLP